MPHVTQEPNKQAGKTPTEPPAAASPSRADPSRRTPRPNRRTRRGRGVKRRVAWYWRLVAWLIAVPLGFVITALPVYELHVVRKNDLLNIFVGTGLARYARLALVTGIWALVIALLVTALVNISPRRHDAS